MSQNTWKERFDDNFSVPCNENGKDIQTIYPDCPSKSIKDFIEKVVIPEVRKEYTGLKLSKSKVPPVIPNHLY